MYGLGYMQPVSLTVLDMFDLFTLHSEGFIYETLAEIWCSPMIGGEI